MIGRTISHYKILEKLGGGAMGVVYRAEDTTLKKSVALKFLPPELTRDGDAKKRFIHEAQAAAALQHNNICTIHEIDETSDGHMFICMDYYEGKPSSRRLHADHSRSPKRSTSPAGSPRGWPRRTTHRWCIVTSSRRTSW